MKNLKLLMSIMTLILISCSKNEPKLVEAIIYPEENPLENYLVLMSFNEFGSLVSLNGKSTEIGFSFKPMVTGKINSIYLRIHKTGFGTKVTIWDVATRFPVYSRSDVWSFTSEPAGNTANLNSVELIKGKEYMITMNTSYYYEYRRNDYQPANYPIKSGNILITGFYYQETDNFDTVFPLNTIDNKYQGNVSFNFQRTE